MDPHDHTARFTRREVIQLLGGAAGLGLVAGCTDFGDPAADAIVRTVRGDISPDAINGVTLFHEHLSIRMGPDRPSATDDVDNVVREIRTRPQKGRLHRRWWASGPTARYGRGDASGERDRRARRGVGRILHGSVLSARDRDDERGSDCRSLVADAARDRLGAFGEIGQNSDAAAMTSERTEGVSAPSARRTSPQVSRSSRTTPTAPVRTCDRTLASHSWTSSNRWESARTTS